MNFVLPGRRTALIVCRRGHRRDRGLAGAGGEFEGQPHQVGVGVMIGVRQMFQESFTALAQLRRDLSQPDCSLDRFDLAEKWPHTAELVVAPVLKEPLGFRLDLPVVGIRPTSPLVHLVAELVDDGGRIVLLAPGENPLAFVENQGRLVRLRSASGAAESA